MLLFGLNASYAHNAQGLYAIRNEMKKNNILCELLECNINDRSGEIFTQLYNKARNHDIVGFSCYIWNINSMCSIACDLKKLIPNIIIIFGGPELASEDDAYFLLHPYVDYIIQGEGEIPLVEFILSFKNGILPKKKIIKSQQFNNFIYTKINVESFPNHDKIRTIYYESSRGCPYSCSYCMSGNKNTVRSKSAEDTISDIENIYKICADHKPPVNVIKFCDRTFNFDIKRANKLYLSFINLYKNYKKIFSPPPIQFELCPTLFDNESFEILSSAPKDLFQLEIGLQSLNKQTLDAINRHVETEKAIKNIKHLKSFENMHIHLDLITGLPYETLSTFANGLNRIYEIGDFIQIGFLKMLKGTKIRREADKYGYKYKSDPPYTVLKNNFMSYDDLLLLSDIERIYEKYSSPAYKTTFDYIYENKYKNDIFSMLQKIAFYFRVNKLYEKNISQRESFKAFYEIFKEDITIKEMLEEDFYGYEKKKIYL